MLSVKDKKRISDLSNLIYLASRKVKILKHISWSENIRIDFFKNNFKKIPKVTYSHYDDSDFISLIKEAEKLFGDTKYDIWLKTNLTFYLIIIISRSKLISSFKGFITLFQNGSSLRRD